MSRRRTLAAAVAAIALGALAAPGLAGGASPPVLQAAPSPESLDMLLAPVALYPDQLLAQMLLCAGKPAKVTELSTWLKENQALKGSALQDAAQKAGFEPSFVALALFPQVVDLMAADPTWTGDIGRAFAADRKAVLDSVQRLRAQSQKVGTLKSTLQQTVETRTTSSGETAIVIEPANPQVVYVPQYNAQTVYTQPPTTTVVVQEEHDEGAAVAAGVIGFTAGIAIGAAIDNDYYYGPYGWHGGPYMYNDDWDDWYDDREDAREDWYENREDAREDFYENRDEAREDLQDRSGERSERAATAQQQRTERQQTRQTASPETQAQREQRRAEAQGAAQQRASGAASTRTEGAAASASQRSAGASSYQSRGYTGERSRATTDRSGTRSDAFSGYSSGGSTRAASSRGQRSRSSAGGGRGRRR